jgi:hypothetical protein
MATPPCTRHAGTKEIVMNRKQAYEERLRAELDEWTAKIDVLKAKADKAEAGAKLKYYETIEELQSKQVLARDKLRRLHEASGDAWIDLKKGVESAWSDLGDAVRSATSRFR